MQKEPGKYECDEDSKRKTSSTTISGKSVAMHCGMQDLLPIVELKPFFKKVWRREKSLPEFYVKLETASADDNYDCKRIQNVPRENQHSVVNCDSKGFHLPCTPNPSYLESRINVETSSRNRTKIHPSTQFSYNCRLQKSPHFIPGFITRAERTKTTLEDAHNWGNSKTKTLSSLKQAISPEVYTGQRQMRVQGGKLNQKSSIKQLFYHNPRTGYSLPRPIDGCHSNPESPFRKANVAYGLYGDEKEKYYVSPALSEGEPSRSSTWSRRHVKSSLKQIKFNKNTETSSKQTGHLSIGGIKNAFQILNNRGKPTNVERKLTFQMDLDLQQCRRRANNCKFPAELATHAHLPNTISPHDKEMLTNLTHGEVMLMHGREANRRKRQASGLSLSQDYVDFDRNVRKIAAVQMELVDIPMGKMERVEDSFQFVIYENSGRNSASGMSNNGPTAYHPGSTQDTINTDCDQDTNKENRGNGTERSLVDIRSDTEGTPTTVLILPEIRPNIVSELEISSNDKLSPSSVATHSEASIINDEFTDKNVPKSTQTENKLFASSDSVLTRKHDINKSQYPSGRKDCGIDSKQPTQQQTYPEVVNRE